MVRIGADSGQIAIFGEVLFDRFEDGTEVLGGAPFNVAWNLAGLGVDPLFLSRVGVDDLGERVRSAMDRWGLTTSGLQADPAHPTGTVDITLERAEPRFEIVGNRAYDHIMWDELPRGSAPSILYLGSLALRERTSRATAQRLVEHHRPRIFVDVNLRPPWWEPKRVEWLLDVADVIKLNAQELSELARSDDREESQAHEILSRSQANQLWVTRGASGAAVYFPDGSRHETRAGRSSGVVDTVGAGDAFSSVLLLGQLGSWNVTKTLTRARELAAAVVRIRGATSENRAFYEQFRDAWRLP